MEKNKMLIDATHPEETRVVVLRNGRVEEFDYESAARKLLRGNIYLAKVTRVEPSLQAAFVEYGGNRHGFLAFNEIHPDYYQIPIADREALKQEEAEAEAAEEAEADARAQRRERSRHRPSAARHRNDHAYEASERRDPIEPVEADDRRDGDPHATHAPDFDAPRHADYAAEHEGATSSNELVDPPYHPTHANYDEPTTAGNGDEGAGVIEVVEPSDNGAPEPEQIETEEDALEEVPERPRRRMRQYKIQEVIKRRQIILIQVVKEERGNKGAALTTYISLAGRYTVLMPNTGRGGGISRKITQPQDRKRLKAIAEELDVPEGMGLIIRTAGAARTKQEIKRDYEYLLRLWESVRDLTLVSTAPCLVYEEGNLIKRSIRDLYSKDIDDVIVAGDIAYREARDFMGMLMPGHDDYVVRYDAPEPLFTRFGIERQLNAMFSPYVTLRSGGYLVINQTEALVSIDVNSGKSTREFSIEETALNTNIEAAEEIARQLKLRDLAGLIVIDFIDMEEKRHNRSVERRLKDALRHDRARIQVGHISHFGLLEMSRQRLRTGVLEGSTSQCPHCQGTGIIRSTESVALAVLRGIEDNLQKQPSSLVATTTATVALYILNNKRDFIVEMERREGISIAIEASDRLQGANFTIDRTAAPVAAKAASSTAVSMDWAFDDEPAAAPAPARSKQRSHDHTHHHGHDHDDEPVREERNDRTPRRGRDERSSAGTDDDAGRGSEDGRPGRRRRRRRGRRGSEGPTSVPAGTFERTGDGGEQPRLADDFVGHADDEPRYIEPRAVDVPPPPPHVGFEDTADAENTGEPGTFAGEAHGDSTASDDERRPRRGRRRGRRGGRSRGRDGFDRPTETRPDDNGIDGEVPRTIGHDDQSHVAPEEPAHSEYADMRHADEHASPAREHVDHDAHGTPSEQGAPAEPAMAHGHFSETSNHNHHVDAEVAEKTVATPLVAQQEPERDDRPARKGWWQRRFGGGN